MINVPAFTGSFYTVVLNQITTQKVLSLLAPTAGDIIKSMITSKSVSSDIAALAECSTSIEQIAMNSGLDLHPDIIFNPDYLIPAESKSKKKKIEIEKEYNFLNPYVMVELKYGEGDEIPIDAYVSYDEFEPAENNTPLQLS